MVDVLPASPVVLTLEFSPFRNSVIDPVLFFFFSRFLLPELNHEPLGDFNAAAVFASSVLETFTSHIK